MASRPVLLGILRSPIPRWWTFINRVIVINVTSLFSLHLPSLYTLPWATSVGSERATNYSNWNMHLDLLCRWEHQHQQLGMFWTHPSAPGTDTHSCMDAHNTARVLDTISISTSPSVSCCHAVWRSWHPHHPTHLTQATAVQCGSPPCPAWHRISASCAAHSSGTST